MQYWKKVIKFFNVLVLVSGMLIPVALFANRFLIPDISFDSINYHVFNGSRLLDSLGVGKYEFFPTGIYNLPQIFDLPSALLRLVLGYRLGTIASLIGLGMTMFISKKLIDLLLGQKLKLGTSLIVCLLFVNCFISYEAFFQLATYYADLISEAFVFLSLFLSFIYLRTHGRKWLIRSSFLWGLSVIGKLSNLIYFLPIILILVYEIIITKKTINNIFKETILLAVFFIIPVIAFSYKDYRDTGNPIFPFYNGIFKSKYYPPENFSLSAFGGRNFKEKLLWPIYALKEPARLGEGNDLFADNKISLYFIVCLISFIFSFRRKKKDKLFWYFNVVYLLSFELWNLMFGYLRYGLCLEVFGGMVLLWWFIKFKEIVMSRLFGKMAVGILILGLVVLDKSVWDMSLKYDVGWRTGFNVLGKVYFENIKYLFDNEIKINDIRENNSGNLVYLNCSVPNLGFLVVSKYSNLPVINIDRRSDIVLVTNVNYEEKVKENILKYTLLNNVNFVTIVGNVGLLKQEDDCKNTLRVINAKVTGESEIDNFLGYEKQKLKVIYGTLLLN